MWAAAVLAIGFAGYPVWGAASGPQATGGWHGVLRNAEGQPIAGAAVEALAPGTAAPLASTTGGDGHFVFPTLAQGAYAVSVHWNGRTAQSVRPLERAAGAALQLDLRISPEFQLLFESGGETGVTAATGGEQLSSRQVSGLPLNKRDFSQLLLLAAGTMTDTNGSVNFTQQFAVNGQRGTTAVFAMDGADSSDPELGGATFSNFNVDAVQEIDSRSGVMAAEVGRGAAGFTNIITKSGSAQVHGSAFEFVRNAAFDARNFFDHPTIAHPGRIPPFIRNEFGFTLGGPIPWPGRRARRTFFFGEYQGFRQILGTTQVLSVPTAQEREGVDTTTFAGDTLWVPVDSRIASVLARYPLPNNSQGSYGARTYATAARVVTTSNQFSVRVDHRISDHQQLFSRFSLNDVNGPLINPSQTAIDPSFATRFLDNQRNAALRYAWTPSPRFTSETALGFERTTPSYPSENHTQPGLKFADSLYEPFNLSAGSMTEFLSNLWQVQQHVTWTHSGHTLKAGFEGRRNRDTFFGGTRPNGVYTFAGGAAWSPVAITSASGAHNINPGDLLPDSLTALLTAAPFSYAISASPPGLPQGDRTGEVVVGRTAYNFYLQDAWKLAPRLSLSYGVRYEVDSRMHAVDGRSSGIMFIDSAGRRSLWDASGVKPELLLNLKPEYAMDWGGWGPRLALAWQVRPHTQIHAGGAITTILPNLAADNLIMSVAPFVLSPYRYAAANAAVPFADAVTPMTLPAIYAPSGQLILGSGQAGRIPVNTPMDVDRFESDLQALSSDHQFRPIPTFGIVPNFRNGYIDTWSVGVEHDFQDVRFDASYIGTAGNQLARTDYPNGAGGASQPFAPFTDFDSAGQIVGGYGTMDVISNRSHSTFHSLQASVSRNTFRLGPALAAGYTYSKSLDDVSSVAFVMAQDPRHPRADKGPSGFDVTHVFSVNFAQVLPFDHLAWFKPLPRELTSGWQLFGVGSAMTGLPFEIISGIQQTAAGAGSADRPDLAGRPDCSTHRNVHEDYFGRGANNASFFYVPIGLSDGTGPNRGRFGTLSRNAFRGPGSRSFDVALIKEISLAGHGSRRETSLQFRAEFFNVFNLVNFAAPASVVLGPGFGVISQTAGTSRQIQFSLKLLF